MPENENNKIEDIKSHLYDVNDSVTNRPHTGTLHSIQHQVSENWNDEIIKKKSEEIEFKKPNMSIFKKFFIVAFIFFLGALGYAYYMFTNGTSTVSNEKIDIAVIGNAFVKGGDVLPLKIEIKNNNTSNLELANLIVEYPRGADDVATDIVRLPRESIGIIEAGASVSRDISVTLFGYEKSVRNVKISLEYHPAGSNLISTKTYDYSVTISTAPLSLTLEAPTTTVSDQLISIKLIAKLNTLLPEGTNIIQVTYPNNFVFDSAIPTPYIGNSVWNLADLSMTQPLEIEIKGKIIGQDNEEQVFHVYAGSPSQTNQAVVGVVYNSLLHSILVTKPFLEAHILVNNQDLPSYSTSPNNSIEGQVSWVNNLSTRVTDAQLILDLSGNAYDRNSVDSQDGHFDSSLNQIVWDKNMIEELGSVEPGQRGSVGFSLKPLAFTSTTVLVKDPQINLSVSIKGKQPSFGSTYSDVDNFIKKTIKIMSDFQIVTSTSFASGVLPPKADTETKYNITWTLSNTLNTISQAQARSVLPVYVKWIGSNTGNEDVTYNSSTREVIWSIKTVRPNTGISSNREASFTLSIKPSLSQVGSVPQLMKEILLTGIDSFTGGVIKSTKGAITTLLTGGNVTPGTDRVVQ